LGEGDAYFLGGEERRGDGRVVGYLSHKRSMRGISFEALGYPLLRK
jgi:hypothetical protein